MHQNRDCKVLRLSFWYKDLEVNNRARIVRKSCKILIEISVGMEDISESICNTRN